MRRRYAATLGALALMLTLGACNGEPTDDPSAALTPSLGGRPTEDPSTATTTPTVDPREETAKQFIRRYVATGNEMQRTGDTLAFRELIGPDCLACKKFARLVERIYSNGGYIESDGERVISLTNDGIPEQWTAEMSAEPTRFQRSAGGRVETLPGGTYVARFYLTRSRHGWTVSDTTELPR